MFLIRLIYGWLVVGTFTTGLCFIAIYLSAKITRGSFYFGRADGENCNMVDVIKIISLWPFFTVWLTLKLVEALRTANKEEP